MLSHKINMNNFTGIHRKNYLGTVSSENWIKSCLRLQLVNIDFLMHVERGVFLSCSLLTICKSFVRSYLDFGDVTYDPPNKSRLPHKIETVQYNAALAINGAIRGTSKEKLYQMLRLESIKDRRWIWPMSYWRKLFRHNTSLLLWNSSSPIKVTSIPWLFSNFVQ